MYRLPEEMREELAKPLGKLFSAAEVASPRFSKALKKQKLVVTVGDRVTDTLWKAGRVPDVQIVDGLENRLPRKVSEAPHSRTVRVKNPAGTITAEAIQGICDAFEGKKPARVVVEGEEDLLAMPALVFAPVGSVVYYGQPGVGVVLVKADSRSKRRNVQLLMRMGVPENRVAGRPS